MSSLGAMSEYRTSAPAHSDGSAGRISVPVLLGAALLIGLGLLAIASWLIWFNWLDFLGILPLILGAYLLFTRGTGPDRA